MDFASYVHQYYKSGYLVYQEGGEAGKVCVDHMNKTVPKADVGRVLNKLGESMCNTLEYRDLVSIEIMVDNEQEVNNVFKFTPHFETVLSECITPFVLLLHYIFHN
jgi:hypothetical protein